MHVERVSRGLEVAVNKQVRLKEEDKVVNARENLRSAIANRARVEGELAKAREAISDLKTRITEQDIAAEEAERELEHVLDGSLLTAGVGSARAARDRRQDADDNAALLTAALKKMEAGLANMTDAIEHARWKANVAVGQLLAEDPCVDVLIAEADRLQREFELTKSALVEIWRLVPTSSDAMRRLKRFGEAVRPLGAPAAVEWKQALEKLKHDADAQLPAVPGKGGA
jgi:hypothetical protein